MYVCYLASERDEGDNAGEMSPGSSTESCPAFAHIRLRENPGKNLNQGMFRSQFINSSIARRDRKSTGAELRLIQNKLTANDSVLNSKLLSIDNIGAIDMGKGQLIVDVLNKLRDFSRKLTLFLELADLHVTHCFTIHKHSSHIIIRDATVHEGPELNDDPTGTGVTFDRHDVTPQSSSLTTMRKMTHYATDRFRMREKGASSADLRKKNEERD
ncbi:hypothetical protein ANN_01234 [Periplaneta americana]|uniref:Uncharacterized protein n=1 Tax=Periplaneta americana TaxID=6978 RepID=A0ABQ8TU30_PERAM|nr:hypothetical protein ANN_01234 [Periplaneta americana]